ncbi:PqqD family protein [Sphingobacterium detergens]|uniref:Coenzyme PQQ synthesis protein D (PqqD) n=1 Tax=Sphingobacterium detergens TaxID=1145106 RepID=A0A420B6L4_SPHD1|nr:PqqD family protein [Sphingobacterium detergens]RKE52313.1 coenzyme PQQ synthesis protein D (PqqD) [Sphingobacterium detergens]
MKLRGDLQLRKLGDEHILVYPGQDQQDASKVYTFNETAVQIWLELQGKEFNVESVTAVLLDNYEVEENEAEKDAAKLVKQFEKQGFLI